MAVLILFLIPLSLLTMWQEYDAIFVKHTSSFSECLRDYIHYNSRNVMNDNGIPSRECLGRHWAWRIDYRDYGVTRRQTPALCIIIDSNDLEENPYEC